MHDILQGSKGNLVVYSEKMNDMERVTSPEMAMERLEKGMEKYNLIEKICAYIEERYGNPDLGLAAISQEFHMTESYISSMFKEHTHINFSEYTLNMMKMEI